VIDILGFGPIRQRHQPAGLLCGECGEAYPCLQIRRLDWFRDVIYVGSEVNCEARDVRRGATRDMTRLRELLDLFNELKQEMPR